MRRFGSIYRRSGAASAVAILPITDESGLRQIDAARLIRTRNHRQWWGGTNQASLAPGQVRLLIHLLSMRRRSLSRTARRKRRPSCEIDSYARR